MADTNGTRAEKPLLMQHQWECRNLKPFYEEKRSFRGVAHEEKESLMETPKRNHDAAAGGQKEEESEGPERKRRKEEGPPSPTKETVSALFHGVVLCAKRNRKKRFFLASKKNDFGGFPVEAVMIDTGCNSILLPLQKDELPALAKAFPFDSFFWDVGNSRGVASRSLTLKIAPSVPGNRIPIRLCYDLLRPEKPCEVDFLRFHLCSEDAVVLRDDPAFFDNLLENGKLAITKFLDDPPSHDGSRRTHALLGQAILQDLVCIQHGSISIAVDSSRFDLSWKVMRDIERFVLGASAETLPLPDHFDDLEDDDHDGDDEDFSLGDDDFSD